MSFYLRFNIELPGKKKKKTPVGSLLSPSFLYVDVNVSIRKKKKLYSWMTDVFLYLCCLSTCVLLPVVVDGEGPRAEGGVAEALRHFYIYMTSYLLHKGSK